MYRISIFFKKFVVIIFLCIIKFIFRGMVIFDNFPCVNNASNCALDRYFLGFFYRFTSPFLLLSAEWRCLDFNHLVRMKIWNQSTHPKFVFIEITIYVEFGVLTLKIYRKFSVSIIHAYFLLCWSRTKEIKWKLYWSSLDRKVCVNIIILHVNILGCVDVASYS